MVVASISWLIDEAVQNAWILDRKANGKRTQLEFRRSIVKKYLTSFGRNSNGSSRPRILKESTVSCHGPDEIRNDGCDHYVGYICNNKRRRCAAEFCSSITRTQCVKCNVSLCIGCFQRFHQN